MTTPEFRPATAQLRHLPATATAEEIDRILEEDGGVIVDNLLPDDLVARLNADFDVLLDARRTGQFFSDGDAMLEFWGRKTKRITGLAQYSNAFIDLLLNKTVIDVADLRILPNARDYTLSSAQLIEIEAGEKAQVLHADCTPWPEWVRGPRRPNFLSIHVVALTRFTAENGATAVVPGSQKWDHDTGEGVPPTEEWPIAYAEMEAGSVLFFHGNVLHGGGANVTARDKRRGMFLGYIAGWLRGEEAVSLGLTTQRLQELPREARYMLGHGAYGAQHGAPWNTLYDMRDGVDDFNLPIHPQPASAA